MSTMMMSPNWANIASVISAMIDVVQLGRDTFQNYYRDRQKDPALEKKAAGLAAALSAYSDEETAAVLARIDGCRLRFIEEGAGEARRRCMCRVLRDVRDGGGGVLFDPEWEKAYLQLRCTAV